MYILILYNETMKEVQADNIEYRKATEVRNNFQDAIDTVHYTKTPMVITKRNKPWAMIVPLPEAQSAAAEIIDEVTEKVTEEL